MFICLLARIMAGISDIPEGFVYEQKAVAYYRKLYEVVVSLVVYRDVVVALSESLGYEAWSLWSRYVP